MDVMSQETVGLPVFISNQGETISSGDTPASTSTAPSLSPSSSPSSSSSSARGESAISIIKSPKRLSQVLIDFAVTSASIGVDTLYKQAQTLLLLDEGDRPQQRRRQSHQTEDLESGGMTTTTKQGQESSADWLD